MAGMAFTSSLTRLQSTSKLAIVLRKPWSFRSSICASPKPSQGRRCYGVKAKFEGAADKGCDAAKKGVDAAKKGADDMKKEAFAAADNAGQKAGEVAGKMSGTAQETANKVKQAAQEAAGKVQQTAEGAWGSVKDTTQKMKDTVVGKADAYADSAKTAVRDEAAKVDRAINSKK